MSTIPPRIPLGLGLGGLTWLVASVAFAQDAPEPPDPGVEGDDATAAVSTPEPAEEDPAAIARGVQERETARRHAASEFHRELLTVEEEVSQLKERVFRSKATLQLLKELVVDATASGSQVMLWHVNDLGSGYSIESVQYFLDGKNIFTKIDPDGGLDEIEELKFHEQALAPGPHDLQVNLVLRGRGPKLFSYLESYQFKVQSAYTFTIEEGKVSLIRVVVDSRGGLKNFEERPTVRYDERKHVFRETSPDGEAESDEKPAKRKRGKAREREDD